MTVAYHLAFPFACLVLPPLASATASKDLTRPLVRRHQSSESLHLGPDPSHKLLEFGEFGEFDRDSQAVDPVKKYDTSTSNHSWVDEKCMAFAFGKKDSNECADSGHHLIFKQSSCKVAADEANLTKAETGMAHFRIHPVWFNNYPKGCFRAPCENGSTCFFFNSDGDDPTSPTGYPVCTRARYMNGTELTCTDKTTDCSEKTATCPSGYELIDSLAACSTAGDCNGRAEGDSFNVALPDASKRMNYPHGCFIDTSVEKFGKVYWNPIQDDNTPTHPVGVPICKAPNELKLSST